MTILVWLVNLIAISHCKQVDFRVNRNSKKGQLTFFLNIHHECVEGHIPNINIS